MLIGNDSHLTYCTNIHPGETWEEVLNNLENYTLPLKKRICPDQKFGIGLRLSYQAAKTLVQEKNLLDFARWLEVNDCYVYTINGFPYGNFHKRTVKDQVHFPDWQSKSRKDYTLMLFEILARLLPDNMDGGVSTSPLTYRHWYFDEDKINDVKIKSTRNIIQVVEKLVFYKEKWGKHLHLDLEPEPDGLIENTSEFLRYYENFLLKSGAKYLSEKIHCTKNEAISHILDHVQLCFDTCHSSVEYEDPENAIREVLGKGINIGKVQISAAIKGRIDSDEMQVRTIVEELEKYNEPNYLHQSVVKTQHGELYRFPDLRPALNAIDGRISGEIRSHYHVPVFKDDFGLLSSTKSDIEKTLAFWGAYEFCSHLELETYTFNILPEWERLDVVSSIERELNWIKENVAVTV